MLRHILHDLEWAIAMAIITLILFLIIANITIQPVIATITETDLAPGKIHCRSEQVLTDEMGNRWQVMFFTNVDTSTVSSLNLRLSGLSSSVNIQSHQPLVIQTATKRYEVLDIFLKNSPLPSIGQYDLKNIFPQLLTDDLLLKIPLENNQATHLEIPQTVVQEWQEVAAKHPQTLPKLPSNFQLTC